jgi:hypothetical protein
MRTITDLASFLSTNSFADVSKAGLILPALAGVFAFALRFTGGKINEVDIEPAMDSALELAILKCRRGTYEDFDKPKQQ